MRCTQFFILIVFLGAGVSKAHAQIDINGAAIGVIVDEQTACVLRDSVIALFVADATLGEIFVIDSMDGSEIMPSFAAPGPNPQGLATGLLIGDPVGASLYVTDPTDERIYHVTAGGTNARALCESSTHYEGATACMPVAGVELVPRVWIANGDRLCLVDTTDGAPVRTIPAPCASAQALEVGRFAGAIGGGPVVSLFVGCGDTIFEVRTSDGLVLNSFAAPGTTLPGWRLPLSLVFPPSSAPATLTSP